MHHRLIGISYSACCFFFGKYCMESLDMFGCAGHLEEAGYIDEYGCSLQVAKA